MDVLCKDCIWYKDRIDNDLAPTCVAENLGTSLLDGKQLGLRAAVCRDQETHCGPRGMWFQPERRNPHRISISTESYEMLRRRF